MIIPLHIAIDSPLAWYLVYDESALLQRMSRKFSAEVETNEYPA